MGRPHIVLPCHAVECPHCGAPATEPCREPSNATAKNPHRSRVLLSLVGQKSTAAAARIEQLLAENDKRNQ